MAVGDTITAARYNIIRARIAAILGLGAGDEGYGQGVSSTTVAAGATVTASQMVNLYDEPIEQKNNKDLELFRKQIKEGNNEKRKKMY